MAEGPRLLLELLQADASVEVVLAEQGAEDDPTVRDLLTRSRGAGWRVDVVERRVVEEIADTQNPQSVLAIAEIPGWTWDDMAPGLIVILDGVQDPGNVGALIRTAVSLGASGAVALEHTADPWGPKAVRASAGAGLRRPLFRADRASTIDELARRKVPLWIATADGEPIGHAPIAGPRLALALGGETSGTSPELDSAATRRVAVEMSAGMESLNVAAAGAILLDRIMGAGQS